MKSPAERKRDERKRMRSKGYKLVQLWIHPLDWPLIRAFVDRVNRKRERS